MARITSFPILEIPENDSRFALIAKRMQTVIQTFF
jgi:hypothetical protein